MAPDTLIVCSCDHKYFPLVRGLLLSILEKPRVAGLGLAFLDIGCDAPQVRWLREHGVRVCRPDPSLVGGLADPALGYRRSQTCRPLLPKLFPDVSHFIWIDSDAWVQDAGILAYLRSAVAGAPSRLLIAPECHYSYTALNEDSSGRHEEMFSYYAPTFGTEIAARMARRVTLNSGLFAMAAANPIWGEWEAELRRIYLEGGMPSDPAASHMAEQTALNVVAARGPRVLLLDPLYNYICLWNPPFRDSAGVVRVALPPNPAVGVVHLAGGWIHFGQGYHDRGLLYQGGRYLSEAEMGMLFPADPVRAAYR